MKRRTTTIEDSTVAVHLLDVGQQMYGDCILCQFGTTTILIDGGHSSDFKGQEGFESIPQQLENMLGHKSPFNVDLLVVTHCHSDHIGCLPAMVEAGVLTCKWALVADEKLGFGRSADDAPDVPSSLAPVIAALREEDHSTIKDDQELEQFLADVATLEDRYKRMLNRLRQNGTKIRRYGRDSIKDLLAEFEAVGMQVMGPEKDHLVICAEAIARFTEDAIVTISNIVSDLGPQNDAAMYRYLVDRPISDAVDRPGKGAALNDQSIVLLFEVAGRKFLLTGDMQFAKPEINGLDPFMRALRQKIKQSAPFDFVKLAHHASYNGFDEMVFQETQPGTSNFAMSGGIDPGHPDPGVLSLLKSKGAALTFARTDRNGLIYIRPTAERELQMEISRGTLNDFTPNTDETLLPSRKPAIEVGGASASLPSVSQPVISETVSGEIVEVLSKVPHRRTRVVLTIDITPGSPSVISPRYASVGTRPDRNRQSQPLPDLKIGGGRKLPNVLFVTNRELLRANIGQLEADHVVQALQSQGHNVLEVPRSTDARQAAVAVRSKLASEIKGVVLLGGYDVIPSQKLDVLDESLRRGLGQSTGDADNFIVWNDEIYGDKDGDGLPELPVSRIPDAKSSQLVFTALQSTRSSTPATRFGIRNRERPFAEGVFKILPGAGGLLRSAPTMRSDIRQASVAADNTYIMLHGADYDGTRFWGEDDTGTVEAFSVQNVPSDVSAVVFTGCCWGALTVELPAAKIRQGQPVAVRSTDASIALSFIASGALAFVGCTGTHYSPVVRPYNYFGGPMHDAFWTGYLRGLGPAEALYQAKVDFIQGMPHGRNSPSERAIEMKILRQFTCLGLGW